MKWLLVLVTIHNLKLQQASLIMAAAENDSPVDSRAKTLSFLNISVGDS